MSHFPMGTLLRFCVTTTLLAPDGVLFNRGSMEEWTFIGTGLTTLTGFGPFTGDFFLGLEKIHKLTVPRVLHIHDKIQWEQVLCSIR